MTASTKNKRGITFSKKNIPPEIYKLLIKKQSEIKSECGCQFSLEATVYKLIRGK